MDEDDSQKTFDPSQKKLEDARKKGDIPKSADIPAAAILIISVFVIFGLGDKISMGLINYSRFFIENAHTIAVDSASLPNLFLNITFNMFAGMLILMSAMSIAALAGHLGQTGLVLSGEKIKPKLDKISPIAGFKRVFGKEALMQFGKVLLKLIALTWVTISVLEPYLFKSELYIGLDPMMINKAMGEILKELLIKLILVLMVFALFDYFLQRFNFMNRNKMSKQEMKDEYKNTEGDPLIAAKLRQIRMEKSRQRMMQNVPKATVIITNPTHYAVALRYEAGENAAPVCVAKGVDRVALKIREIANEHDVPIIEDRPLARALFAQVEIDETIPAEFYEAVAKIIGKILSHSAKRQMARN